MSIALAQQHLLEPTGITIATLEETLAFLHQQPLDFSDLYFQSSRHESWMLEDGIVKEGSFNIERGVGVRAVQGEKTGFAYADEITPSAIRTAATAARGIARSASHAEPCVALKAMAAAPLYPAEDPLNSWDEQTKIALLHEMEAEARRMDPRVKQVIASISGVYEQVLVAASDGTLAADYRPLVRLNCTVLAEQDGRRERGSAGGGGRGSYEMFLASDNAVKVALGYAREAVRQATVNLAAIDAPAGTMPVVLGAGWPGVLLHEAVGHGLEGDFNRKGTSAFAGKVGELVASPLCTVVDDGTMAGRRGSLSIDDEGTPGQYTTLIEEGVLKGYMQDKLNARLMGEQPTGNGRRESYAHLPMPRMTNTYMLPGEHTPEAIIASVESGIYAPNFGGGQVDITSGRFVFSASEAYLIENGQVTKPIKGATLIGVGAEAMQQISMVGNDLALDKGVGVCGKDGQSVPVGVGQPTIKLDQLTVGGTA
ncbi:metalloprotease TldD [Corallincola luteus]|uniref:Metalloprotease TldD n=2 Tax=Corallincola TaxID=1775176 RepID=A0A368NIZ3_9GAMM|nr:MULTISPECIES: metalloprotease TldD [Corallincola]RCU49843.1 metalloprotease TldD [Corallincola holothuriorum]TCI03543.1 metalloprotease TldD [Corallincola luteus]